jgi:hypothetical protein
MKKLIFCLLKPTDKQLINTPFFCESFDNKLFTPKVTKAWFESLLGIRQGKTIHLYIPEVFPVSALVLWLGIAKEEQDLSYGIIHEVGDIILWFFDKESNSYREQYFGHEDDFELLGTDKNPVIPEEFM